jgi:hypothetical protein
MGQGESCQKTPRHRKWREEFMMKSVLKILATTTLVTPAAAWARDAAEEDQGGLEEIVVTAQKRAESLSDVPISTTLTGNLGTAYTGIFDRPRNIAVQASVKF